MSDDIQKEPVSPRGPLPAEGPDYPPLDYDEPPYPAVVKAAGVMWIVFGCMGLLNMAAMLLLTFVLAANMKGANAGAAAGGGACVSVLVGLFGAAFLYVGVQSVRGTAAGTMGNGIGSLVFGLLNVGGTAVMALAGNIVGAAINGVGGVLLLTAGVLALAGGSQYKLWRKAQKARQDRETAERRARRRFVK
jgi:hypothetical protein